MEDSKDSEKLARFERLVKEAAGEATFPKTDVRIDPQESRAIAKLLHRNLTGIPFPIRCWPAELAVHWPARRAPSTDEKSEIGYSHMLVVTGRGVGTTTELVKILERGT